MAVDEVQDGNVGVGVYDSEEVTSGIGLMRKMPQTSPDVQLHRH